MSAQALRDAYREEIPPVLSGKELFEFGDIGRAELIQGRLRAMSPTGYPHGIIEITIASLLRAFVRPRKLGKVLGGEVGIFIRRQPDTIRGADVAYISNARLAQNQASQGYLDVAPELIVEVLSPGDRWTDVMQKLAEYLQIGARSVWIADPGRQEIFVYHALTDVQRFTAADAISDEAALPGFSASVAEIFDINPDEEAQTHP